MKLEIKDSSGEVLQEVEFDMQLSSEPRVIVSSSTGSTTHTFYKDTPSISITVPGMAPGAMEGEDAPANNVRDISEVVGPYSRPLTETVPPEPEPESENVGAITYTGRESEKEDDPFGK